MSINRFEDLTAWQNARELTKAIYVVSKREKFAKDEGLAGQLQRASVAIMSNIAEGFERGSNADFYRFLFLAKASCAEVRSELYVALDVGYISAEECQKLQGQAEEVTRLLSGLRASVGRKSDQ